MVSQALASGEVQRAPILNELFRPEGKLLGDSTQPAFRVLSPVGIVTASDRPLFRWAAVPGASDYIVSVYDGSFRKVAESPKLTTNQWQPTQPLMRGSRLSWQITAHAGEKEERFPSPPAREAIFEVMNSDTAKDIGRG